MGAEHREKHEEEGEGGEMASNSVDDDDGPAYGALDGALEEAQTFKADGSDVDDQRPDGDDKFGAWGEPVAEIPTLDV